MKKVIRLSQHARERLAYRGTTTGEITKTIKTSPWAKAELGRLQCQKEFTFNKIWNGKKYKTKQVKPIFIEEKDEIVVITIYVYYC